jgi:predicted SnoaL-like aldol condensation-catalyzing enzyme
MGKIQRSATVLADCSNACERIGKRQPKADAMSNNAQKNKRTVVDFYDMMFNQSKPMDAVRQFVGKEYAQHNPKVEDGKDGFIAYFSKMAKDFPGKSVQFKRVIAEGNFVVLHTHQKWPGGPDWAGIDIFRLDEDGKIVEHWDVLQQVPKKSANSNSMF